MYVCMYDMYVYMFVYLYRHSSECCRLKVIRPANYTPTAARLASLVPGCKRRYHMCNLGPNVLALCRVTIPWPTNC